MKHSKIAALIAGAVLLIAGAARAMLPGFYAILNIDQASVLLAGGDWDPGYFKGTCADGMANFDVPYGLWQFSWNGDGSIHNVTCAGPQSGDGCNATPGLGAYAPNISIESTTLINDNAEHRSGLTPMEWDLGYFKTECPAVTGHAGYTDSAMVGISQSTTNGTLHAIRCAGLFANGFYSNSTCFSVGVANTGYSYAGQSATTSAFDFAVGYNKTACGNRSYVAGISHDANGKAHKLLCCTSPL